MLLASLLLTAGAAEQIRRLGVQQHRRIASTLLTGVGDAIGNKLNVDIALLSSVVGLFRASETVSRREFATFYASIATSSHNLQGIQGVGFSRSLTPGQLPAFVRSMRAEGFPDFAVRPAGARPHYSAIEFLEPFDWRNQRAFGYDMYSEPTRHAAMERAVRTGLPSLSGRVTLVQETESDIQPGVVLYLPIYRGQGPNPSAERRLSQLVGWAYSPLRTRDLIQSALKDIKSGEIFESRVVVYDGALADGAAPRQERLLFDSLWAQGSWHDPPGQAAYRPVALAGRTWTVGVELAPHLIGPSGISAPFWIALTTGLGISGLLAWGSHLLVDTQLRTRQALAISQRAIEERALASTVFEASSLAIVVTNAEGRILTANNAFTQLSGYRLTESVGQRTNLLKSGKHGPDFYRQMWDALLGQGFWEGDLWNKVRSGELRRHHLAISTVRDDQLRPAYYVGMLQDITDRHAAEQAVRHQALHDSLTGLANRSLLIEQLDRQVALGRRHGQAFGVLYLDLDGFKPVNDRLGHAAGDALLQQVAERLGDCVRESDLVCRQGGDEFVVLVAQVGPMAELVALAERMLTKLREPFQLEQARVQIGASIGIARFPDHGATTDALLHAADTAMYAAKEGGGGQLQVSQSEP